LDKLIHSIANIQIIFLTTDVSGQAQRFFKGPPVSNDPFGGHQCCFFMCGTVSQIHLAHMGSPRRAEKRALRLQKVHQLSSFLDSLPLKVLTHYNQATRDYA